MKIYHKLHTNILIVELCHKLWQKRTQDIFWKKKTLSYKYKQPRFLTVGQVVETFYWTGQKASKNGHKVGRKTDICSKKWTRATRVRNNFLECYQCLQFSLKRRLFFFILPSFFIKNSRSKIIFWRCLKDGFNSWPLIQHDLTQILFLL